VTTATLDLRTFTEAQLVTLAQLTGLDVSVELSRRCAFLSQGEALTEAALVSAKLSNWRLNNRVTALAKVILEDLGVEDLLKRLLATADLDGTIYDKPTLEQINPPVEAPPVTPAE
jgi:hypothetical protein